MQFCSLNDYILLFAFVWSGFVRGGLGFGGAALMMPIALLGVNSPLEIVPIIAVQLFIFSLATVLKNYRNVNWYFVIHFTLLLSIPVAMGLFGLVAFPSRWLMSIVYIIVVAYAFQYIYPIKIKINTLWLDFLVIFIGGYMLGISLTGGPPIVAVAMKKLPKEEVRDTLFTLWSLLSAAKLTALYFIGVNLHLSAQLWLFPAALVGHIIGVFFHKKLLRCKGQTFYRLLGSILLLVTVIGLIKIWH